jgi:hypothetical protein
MVLQQARATKILKWLRQAPLRTPIDYNSLTDLGRIIEFRSRDTEFRVEVAVGRNIVKLASAN